jgi:flagellar basal body-associated protein FliL
MRNKLLILIMVILIGIIAILSAVIFFLVANRNQPVIRDFSECAQAGNPVMESYPRQCRSSDGRLFIEEVPLS